MIAHHVPSFDGQREILAASSSDLVPAMRTVVQALYYSIAWLDGSRLTATTGDAIALADVLLAEAERVRVRREQMPP
jgi:hypothetical protein